MTDLTFQAPEGTFNYRVCALLIHDGRLLVMKDSDISHYYLPCGRARFGETAEAAVARELEEELGIRCENFRPLWLDQNIFCQ